MSRMHFRISTVGTASLTTTEKLHSWSSAQKPSRLRGGIRLLSLWTVVEEGTIVTSNLISRWLDPGYFDLLSTCAVFFNRVLWLNCEIQWPAFAISTRHENSLNLKDHWVIFHWLVNGPVFLSRNHKWKAILLLVSLTSKWHIIITKGLLNAFSIILNVAQRSRNRDRVTDGHLMRGFKQVVVEMLPELCVFFYFIRNICRLCTCWPTIYNAYWELLIKASSVLHRSFIRSCELLSYPL